MRRTQTAIAGCEDEGMGAMDQGTWQLLDAGKTAFFPESLQKQPALRTP